MGITNRGGPAVCVLTGYGINCDVETEFAFNSVGGRAERVHVNDLIEGRRRLKEFQIFVVPGGFSFGDDIASGKVLANKIRTHLRGELLEFIEGDRLILGICNGFQVLVKMGLLPGLDGPFVQQVTLTYNRSGRYEDRWVYLKVEDSPCVFTRGLETLYLPVAHGEGRFTDGVHKGAVLRRIESSSLVALRYADEHGNPADGRFPLNPNGSDNDIAGVCDPSGRIFGLMPHPERFLHYTHHPCWTRAACEFFRSDRFPPMEGAGAAIFRNAVRYFC